MKKYFFALIILLVQYHGITAQETPKDSVVVLKTPTGDIFGSLLVANSIQKTPVALIIAGSGPTDRDGNNPMMKNNSLKFLAEGLAKNGISSLRFDKRGIAASRAAGLSEADLRFDDYVDDAKAWIGLLKKDSRFSSISVVGHSEGSLIGMIASQKHVDKYISLAGAGRPAADIILNQLSGQPAQIKEMVNPIVDSLRAGKLASKVSPMLYALFRPQVQPYMISWFKYDPTVEIAKLTIPVLIIQGTSDIQVKVDDANFLAKANKKASLKIIPDMNHIFRTVKDGNRQANILTYSKPDLPLADGLLENVVQFLK